MKGREGGRPIFIHECMQIGTSPLVPPSRPPPKTVCAESSENNVVFGTLGWSALQKTPLFRMKWDVQKFESKMSDFLRYFDPFLSLFDPNFLYKIGVKKGQKRAKKQ